MGNPDKGFAGRIAEFAMTVLSAAVIIVASSGIAHANIEAQQALEVGEEQELPPPEEQEDSLVAQVTPEEGEGEDEGEGTEAMAEAADFENKKREASTPHSQEPKEEKAGSIAYELGVVERWAANRDDNTKEKERVRIARVIERSEARARAKAEKQALQGEFMEPAAENSLPVPSTEPRTASAEDALIINFDQAIIRRFEVSGSCLDKGELGDNIVKDDQGREFLNVMAFWDVLVEPQDDGINHYYGSIQFPLGSRHPAIITSTVPEDEIESGCRADEVLVLKGFETGGIDYSRGLMDAYLAYYSVMEDGTVAFQEEVRQPCFILTNVETGCISRDVFSRSDVDPDRMGHDKTLYRLPVREE